MLVSEHPTHGAVLRSLHFGVFLVLPDVRSRAWLTYVCSAVIAVTGFICCYKAACQSRHELNEVDGGKKLRNEQIHSEL